MQKRGVWSGGQGECNQELGVCGGGERRIEVIVKMYKKSRGSGSGREGVGDRADVNEELKLL